MIVFDCGLVTVIIVQRGRCYGRRSYGDRIVLTVRLKVRVKVGVRARVRVWVGLNIRLTLTLNANPNPNPNPKRLSKSSPY